MYSLVRSMLFLLPPEVAHKFTMRMLAIAYHIPPLRYCLRNHYVSHAADLSRTVFGLTFPNPVGLAAGFDKDARHVDTLAMLGFGFVEIGTLTPRPQPGNSRPRLFRLPKDQALINRMGFNNGGASAARERLAKRREHIIVGGNIGKNKDTPNEQAADDYEKCFRELFDVVDYFVVNVSSPNTPGLRELQDRAPLTALLGRLQTINKEHTMAKPILLKIAPDLTDTQLDEIVEIVRETGLAGIVATNTTISRSDLETPSGEVEAIGAGGLSGAPLRNRSTEIIRHIHTLAPELPIIASGGIFTAADAQEKLDAGASLVQVYTGFIYEGPTIVRDICKTIK